LVETLAYPKIIIVLIYVQTKIKRTLIYEKRLIELYMFKNENSKQFDWGRLTKRIIKYVSVNLSNFIVLESDIW
jgi:hypothetical protein